MGPDGLGFRHKPINTAPKDGTTVLLFWEPVEGEPPMPDGEPCGIVYGLCHWHDGQWVGAVDRYQSDRGVNPDPRWWDYKPTDDDIAFLKSR